MSHKPRTVPSTRSERLLKAETLDRKHAATKKLIERLPASMLKTYSNPSRSQHRKALSLAKVRPFVLYSLRHTFLTRLGESGCDAWTLARIAGHSSIAISSRYVHPSENAVLDAVERMGGHKIGHSRIARSRK